MTGKCECSFCEFEEQRSKAEWERFSAFFLQSADENGWSLPLQMKDDDWNAFTRDIVSRFDQRMKADVR